MERRTAEWIVRGFAIFALVAAVLLLLSATLYVFAVKESIYFGIAATIMTGMNTFAAMLISGLLDLPFLVARVNFSLSNVVLAVCAAIGGYYLLRFRVWARYVAIFFSALNGLLNVSLLLFMAYSFVFSPYNLDGEGKAAVLLFFVLAILGLAVNSAMFYFFAFNKEVKALFTP